jgi:hypothetical protein
MINYKSLSALQNDAHCFSSRRDIHMVSVGDVENSYALQQMRKMCVIGVRSKTNRGKWEKLVSSESNEQ